MAFTHFYVQTTGSNVNAGSTTDNAAVFTYAGGTFVRSTGVFVVASGNPASDGVTVGHFASVYTTAGAVAATFVAQITARDALSITVDVTTLKWGLATAVSEVATATTLKVGGAWASEIVLAATGLGTFTVPVSTKINIKAATYTLVASRTVSMVGTTTAPLWMSGYNTTPGDLDTDTTGSLSKPLLSLNATFALTGSGAFQTWSGLSILADRNGYAFIVTGASSCLSRCRIENINTGTSTYALSVAAAGVIVAYSWFKAPTTGTVNAVVQNNSNSVTIFGCAIEGGGLAGAYTTGGAASSIIQSTFLNNTGSGILNNVGHIRIANCTIRGASVDGVKWNGTPGAGCFVIGNLFSTIGGYGINNASGANTGNVIRACNDFHSITSGDENGFGDVPAWFGQTESIDPHTSSTNLSLVAGATALATGFPGIFENQVYASYLDAGAVQKAAGAAGGLLIHPGMSGGLRG